ncbi:hypothetical protein TVAG_314740 [Trichomonas vaginalis G3]|uniref:Uncharacterized protein n=1 Tax=Trichomonas vaginalis (strain ATCC PRA-98 / G3) TaxID=412133 RepID=A2ETR3_TRIV3|nr:hypothetical protein TVAGG3_0046070 [Trichomonas vaginalis G3]EAY03944.1 hypothetical protein TVAG_314740 [Trichomonas vaginalis G3]KAI5541036.1 hypothetical protein TVAGG3_0046070 [Trichomonas vaginalis G3]|eukprot:XP_001316167.1 hypothetical protein [Trichomonas vaginalis G3]
MKKNKNEQFQNTNAQKTWERMELISMVPLDIDPKNSSAPPKSALEQNYNVKIKPISKFGKMLDYSLSANVAKSESSPPAFHHKITSYKPAFKFPETAVPEPASYNPNFNATKSTIARPKIGELPTIKAKEGETTQNILDSFSLGLRTFDTNQFPHPVAEPITDIDPDKSFPQKYKYTFDHQASRNDDMFKTSLNTTADFYIEPPKEPKGVEFGKQVGRTHIVKADEGRDYSDNAIPQLDNLKAKARGNLSMSHQISRDYAPPKNERVAFLDALSQQQKQMLERIHPRRSQSRLLPPPKETFSLQASRPEVLPPKPYSESKFPIDPLKSLKYIWPKTPAIKIPNSLRETKDFWKPGQR